MPGKPAVPARVLIADDESSQWAIVAGCLEPLRLDVVGVSSTAEAIQRLGSQRFQTVLCDLVMADGGGMEVLRFARSHGIQTPVIMTGYGDEETAEDWVAADAFDFVSKPVDRPSLRSVLRRALLRSGLLFEEAPAPQPTRPAPAFPHFIGTSDAMQAVLTRVAKLADADTNVCVYGESGTGKELVARAIHYSGPRAGQPLIVLDCAAIPEGLMESEMFGHVRGSFTSALTDREGVFQLADGGTLFLDEVGELSLPLQAKLLRVIQCREFRKVGGKHPIKVNVRIIAATNKDLRALVADGKFREDLFYRLEVIPITLPPLRQHKEDIPVLVDHFIIKFNRNNKKQIRGLSSTTMGVLLRYAWPGNVRELENCIERAAVMADSDILDVGDLAQVLRPGVAAAAVEADPWPQNLEAAERNLILRTLRSMQGNRTRAAELLGISLRGLHYKLKAYGSAEAIPVPTRTS